MKIDVIELLDGQVDPDAPNHRDAVYTAAREEIKALRAAGRCVVDARYYRDEGGWDKLKKAIADLEGLGGRSCPP